MRHARTVFYVVCLCVRRGWWIFDFVRSHVVPRVGAIENYPVDSSVYPIYPHKYWNGWRCGCYCCAQCDCCCTALHSCCWLLLLGIPAVTIQLVNTVDMLSLPCGWNMQTNNTPLDTRFNTHDAQHDTGVQFTVVYNKWPCVRDASWALCEWYFIRCSATGLYAITDKYTQTVGTLYSTAKHSHWQTHSKHILTHSQYWPDCWFFLGIFAFLLKCAQGLNRAEQNGSGTHFTHERQMRFNVCTYETRIPFGFVFFDVQRTLRRGPTDASFTKQLSRCHYAILLIYAAKESAACAAEWKCTCEFVKFPSTFRAWQSAVAMLWVGYYMPNERYVEFSLNR